MSNLAGVAVVVVTKKDDHVEAINTALRDAGHAAHCIRVEKIAGLEAAIREKNAELVAVFGTNEPEKLKPIISACAASDPEVTV